MATCKKCGMWVQVLPHPMSNEINIGGTAVALNCPRGLMKNPTTTMQAVREANEMWFSSKNKKFFQDVSYRVLHSSSGQPYLVRSTYAWSDMFGGQKKLQWRINDIGRDLKIGRLLDKKFDTLEDVKEWLQS
jgi:hypothetical protein